MPSGVRCIRRHQWLLLHKLLPWRRVWSTKMSTEKLPSWEHTTKSCVQVVPTTTLLHKCQTLAMLRLIRHTFRHGEDHWQSFGSDRSAPQSHMRHVEIISVRLSFLSARLAARWLRCFDTSFPQNYKFFEYEVLVKIGISSNPQ